MIIRRIARKVAQKKVAAYARVSTLTEEQEESYETQINYYTQVISRKDGWEMVGMYADPGITGTSARKRPQFMRMIEDAKAGKINLILCKSISRFSRNFKETQEFVHDLKAVNVEVWFEKEGIHTFDPSTDLIFSLMAAIAQEESRAISENVKWSYRRMGEKGIRHLGNNRMLGFDEVDGKLTPNKEAWIVRMIFEEYVSGKAPIEILAHLQEKGAQRMRSDKPFNWSTALRILKNEAYVGDRLIQKAPPQNFLTKRPDPLEAYDSKYIRNDHEAIVSRETWEKAQERLKKERESRENGLNFRTTSHFLYGKVFCPECGEPYRRYTARRGAEERYKTWRCRGHANGSGCKNRHIRESELLQGIADELGINLAAVNTETVACIDRILIRSIGIEVRLREKESTRNRWDLAKK